MRPLLLSLSLLTWLTVATPLDRAMLALYGGEDRRAAALLARHRDTDPTWQFLEARLALAAEELGRAERLLTRFLQQQPASVHRLEARHLRSLLRRYRGNVALPPFLALGRHLEQGRPERWRQQAAHFLRHHPDNPLASRVALQRGRIQLEWFDDPQGAIELYRQAAERYPDGATSVEARFGQLFCLLPQQPQAAAHQLERLSQELPRLLRDDDLLRRSWRRRLEALRPLTHQPLARHDSPLLWSSGARLNLDKPTGSGRDYRPLWTHLPPSQLPVQQLTLWISRHSDWRWLQPDLLLAAGRAGYSPVVALWYFGDEISPEFVRHHRQAYLELIRTRLIPLLKPLPQVTLLLEPEFNKNGIDRWPGWPQLMAEVTALLREQLPQARLGLVMGDWLAPDQPLTTPVIDSLALGDFVASMLMVSPHTELSHQGLEWSPWARTLRLSQRLKARLDLPYRLAYLALPSQPGWQRRQALELSRLERILPALRHNNLVSVGWFSATDDPRQRGWFAESEPHFGLFDKEHRPKASAPVLQRMATPPPPPRILADHSTARRLDLQLSGWGHWYLEDGAGHRLSGSGDRLTLPLPLAGLQGEVTLRLHPRGEWLYRLTLPRGAALPLQDGSGHPFRLHQWQRLTLPRPMPADATGVWLKLALDRPLQDHLWLGVSDDDGFERSARAIGYGDPGQNRLLLHLPLTQLAQPWRRYRDGAGFQWRQTPQGRLRLTLSNSGTEPLSGQVQGYGWLTE